MKANTPENITKGDELKRLRLSKNLSLKEASISTGIPYKHLNDLEAGRRCWTAEKETIYREAIAA